MIVLPALLMDNVKDKEAAHGDVVQINVNLQHVELILIDNIMT